MDYRAAAQCAVGLACVAFAAVGDPAAAVERIVVDSATGLPSFIGGRQMSAGARGAGELLARDYFEQLAAELGIRSLRVEFEQVLVESANGFSRYRYQQLYQGFPVMGAEVSIVIDARTGAFSAANSTYVPAITLSDPTPSLRAADAVRIVERVAPSAGVVDGATRLVLLPADTRDESGEHRLVWLVSIFEEPTGYAPISKTYAVDAADGFVLDSIEHLHDALDREVADKTRRIDRTEGQGRTGSDEVDSAFDLLGEIYDYFFERHAWDSWNGAGVRLKADVNDSSVATGNAYFSSAFGGFKFAPRMIHRDVTAHEFAHGVVDATAKLAYRYESGALNESFADVFGVLVDGDYLIGETIPADIRRGYGPDAGGGTRRALRNVDDPAEMNQPDHTSVFRALCANEDLGGVHVNSGIPNKAFAVVSRELGMERAGRIYFQALRAHLSENSSFADARAALEQAAEDLYPGDAAVLGAVSGALDAVGMTSDFVRPEKAGCSVFGGYADGCPVQRLTRQQRAGGGAGVIDQIVAAYRLRDDFFRKNPGFADYFMPLYNQHVGTMASMVATDREFAEDAARLMRQLAAPILAIGTSDAASTEISAGLVAAAGAVVARLEARLRGQGQGGDADALRQRYDQLDPDSLAGRSVAAAVEQVRGIVDPGSASPPSDVPGAPDPADGAAVDGVRPAEENTSPNRF